MQFAFLIVGGEIHTIYHLLHTNVRFFMESSKFEYQKHPITYLSHIAFAQLYKKGSIAQSFPLFS